MIGTQSDSIGMDVGSSEPVAGDESSGSATRLSQGVKSASGSIATESTTSVVGVGVKTGGSRIGGPELCV